MHSLSDLNTYGQTTLELTDNRSAKIIFDRLSPITPADDFRYINVSGDYKYYPLPGIEVVEIINYNLCEPYVTISIVSSDSGFKNNSSISWDESLPQHLTVTETNKVYVINGLKSPSDWDAVKNFTWNLFGGYVNFPLWYLEVSINYLDQESNEIRGKSWVVADPRFYYVSKMVGEFTETTIISKIMSINKALTVNSTVLCEPGPNIQGRAYLSSSASMTASIVDAVIKSNFTVSASGNRSKLGRANITATATVYARPYDFDKAQANITATATLSCTVNTTPHFVARHYVSSSTNDVYFIISGSNLYVEFAPGVVDGPFTGSNIAISGGQYYANLPSAKKYDTVIRGNLTKFQVEDQNSFTALLTDIVCFNEGLETLTVGNQSLFTNVPSKLPSSVTSLVRFLDNCDAFNDPNIVNWETGNVTNMNYAFQNNSLFDQDLSGWDVHQIPTKPTTFGNNSPNFPTSKQPVWGTYGS